LRQLEFDDAEALGKSADEKSVNLKKERLVYEIWKNAERMKG